MSDGKMVKFEAVETGLNTYAVREDGCTIHSNMSKDKAERTVQEYNSGKLVRVTNRFGRKFTTTKEELDAEAEYQSHWYNDNGNWAAMGVISIAILVGIFFVFKWRFYV